MKPLSRVPTCRRPGCPEPAVEPYGYCLTHDLRYAQWRSWRDEQEQQDLHDAGVKPGTEPSRVTAQALDTLWEYLTPGPFTGERR